MNIAMYIASPVVEFITIIAFLAMVFVTIHLFLEKTKMGAYIKDKTAWLGWTVKTVEDQYNGFRIHSSNYIRTTR